MAVAAAAARARGRGVGLRNPPESQDEDSSREDECDRLVGRLAGRLNCAQQDTTLLALPRLFLPRRVCCLCPSMTFDEE